MILYCTRVRKLSRSQGRFRRFLYNYCAAGASLRVLQNRSRAGSPRRSAGGARLVDFLREFDVHLWVIFSELLAVTGRLLGVLGVVHGASRSGQTLSVHPYVHPFASFFFRAVFGATKWNCSRRNVKKDVQISDIALVEWSRMSNLWSGSNYILVELAFHMRVVVVAGIRK